MKSWASWNSCSFWYNNSFEITNAWSKHTLAKAQSMRNNGPSHLTELILIPLWSLNYESVLSHRLNFLHVSVFCYIYTRQYLCLASVVVLSARSLSSLSLRFHTSFPLKTIILILVMTLFLSTPSFILDFQPSCPSAGLMENITYLIILG